MIYDSYVSVAVRFNAHTIRRFRKTAGNGFIKQDTNHTLSKKNPTFSMDINYIFLTFCYEIMIFLHKRALVISRFHINSFSNSIFSSKCFDFAISFFPSIFHNGKLKMRLILWNKMKIKIENRFSAQQVLWEHINSVIWVTTIAISMLNKTGI